MSQQINLFNPAYEPQKHRFGARAMAVALGVLVIGLVALVLKGQLHSAQLRTQLAHEAATLKQRQAKLELVNREFAPRARDPRYQLQIEAAQQQLTAMRNIADAVARDELGDTSGLSGYFTALARQSTQGIWLTGVSVGANGAQLAIHGRTTDAALVPRYLDRLRHEALMQGKSFAGLRIEQPAAVSAQGQNAPAPHYSEFSLQAVSEGGAP